MVVSEWSIFEYISHIPLPAPSSRMISPYGGLNINTGGQLPRAAAVFVPHAVPWKFIQHFIRCKMTFGCHYQASKPLDAAWNLGRFAAAVIEPVKNPKQT
jgi:hypothetical protein